MGKRRLEKDFNKVLGVMIKWNREFKDLSQCDVKQRTGIGQPSLSRIESGCRSIRAYELYLLCDSISVTPSVLIKAAGSKLNGDH